MLTPEQIRIARECADRVLVRPYGRVLTHNDALGTSEHLALDVIGLLDDNAELHQSLDMALGPHCTGCGNPIDPDTCWCGDSVKASHDGHGFVPMGCDCGRVERDWKKLASTLRALLYIKHDEIERVAKWVEGDRTNDQCCALADGIRERKFESEPPR